MDDPRSFETFRWKGRRERRWGIVRLARDRDGSRRVIAEGDWLCVAYARDQNRAAIESIEQAPVERTFTTSDQEGVAQCYVSAIRIRSVVGEIDWRGRPEAFHGAGRSYVWPADPRLATAEGRLRLPTGEELPTRPGKGFFEVEGKVRAFESWRDDDVREGWAVITEVARSVPADLRPLLAALPLLLFSAVPTA